MKKAEAVPEILKDAGVWRSRAAGQRYVAEVLLKRFLQPEEQPLDRRRNWRQVALFAAIAYHLGLALELAAKGAIAAQAKGAPPASHRLSALCAKAGLKLDAAETELARRLTAAVEWWGHYSAPKRATDLEAAFGQRSITFDRDIPLLDDLLDRLGVNEADAT